MAEEPEFRQEGSDLPKGSLTAMEEFETATTPSEEPSPDVPDVVLEASDLSDETEAPPALDEMEQYAFGSSDRMDEPLTAGVDFGPGPSQVVSGESNEQFLDRFARRLASGRSEAGKNWAQRRLEGA